MPDSAESPGPLVFHTPLPWDREHATSHCLSHPIATPQPPLGLMNRLDPVGQEEKKREVELPGAAKEAHNLWVRLWGRHRKPWPGTAWVTS